MFVSTRQLHRILCGSDTGLSTDVSMYINEQESSHSGLRGGGAAPPIFSLSTHLPNTKSVHQCFVADTTRGKSSLSAKWARTKSVRRQIGLERSLFVGKMGSNEVCLSAKWARTKSVCWQIGAAHPSSNCRQFRFCKRVLVTDGVTAVDTKLPQEEMAFTGKVLVSMRQQ